MDNGQQQDSTIVNVQQLGSPIYVENYVMPPPSKTNKEKEEGVEVSIF